MSDEKKGRKPNRYQAIIAKVFDNHYEPGLKEFVFHREEFEETAAELDIKLPKNVGDVLYNFRYRYDLPENITSTAEPGLEWIILGAGKAKYRFLQFKLSKIEPRSDLLTIKIPDSTPEIISAYALGDEQALLAKVRYNRLIDVFLGVTAYSLQNHLRTFVQEVGQIEIDEVYVGVNQHGQQFIIPTQAKGGKDKHGVVQTIQDISFCKAQYPDLVCRAVSAQFMDNNRIAIFELMLGDNEVNVVKEKHYTLVPSSDITKEDLSTYSRFD
ncbi:hypothetical protein [Halomonas elongata]|uniref:hypothetical protein n=1 Tax=Halomonas elongata TaxID=2746 RepID=UPI0023B08026|nr:hypothetical protein [Halomonas elongata]